MKYKNNLNYFRIIHVGTGTEQLPTDSSEEEALAKNEDGSGVIINNTREDNVKMINPIPETVSDSKFANFQEEMQGKLDNGISNKGNNFTNISANFYFKQTENISL